MKKINKILIAIILVVSSFFLGANFLTAGGTYAEGDNIVQPSYYFVRKEYLQANGTTYTANESDPLFKEGDAVLLGSKERLAVVLGENTLTQDYIVSIRKLTYTIKINDNLTFGESQNSVMEDYGIEIKIDDKESSSKFKLIANPANVTGDKSFIYGKYSITFSYYFSENGIDEEQIEFTSNMYILNYEDYSKDSFAYENIDKDKELSGDCFADITSAELPYLKYNYKNFNLEIVKSYKGLSTTTNIIYNGNLTISSLDETQSLTPVHNVSVVYSEQTKKVYVTFKDLGVYYLTFTPINPNGQNEAISSFYQETINLKETVHVFGFTPKYTSQEGLQTFRQSSSEEIVFDGPQIVKAPWKIAGTKYNADITSMFKNGFVVEDLLNIDINTIAKTNQAPIYFETNANLKYEDIDGLKVFKSSYYYFKDLTEIDAVKKDSTKLTQHHIENYQAGPLSRAGIYYVELEYTYSGNKTSSYKQHFLFRITNDAPGVEIYTIDNSQDTPIKTNINNEEYTCKDVLISKSQLDVFDSNSSLMVYKDASFSGTYDAGVEVLDEQTATFNETARYKVELKYGNEGKKGFVSYFVIDKSPIEEIEFHNLNKTVGTSYTIGNLLEGELITDQAVALSWKPKASGAPVVAEYKFFPTAYSSSNASSLTSSELKTLYNSQQYRYSIPSTHTLNYNGGIVPLDDYANTYQKRTLLESEVLSAGGLYIFKLYDITGSEPVYYSLFIDKTPNTIITTDGTTYNAAFNDEITTENISVLFGKTKFIKINSNVIADDWLASYLNTNNSAQYKNKTYLTVGINNKVYYTRNTDNKNFVTLLPSSGADDLGYSFNLDSENDESEYTFYTICESTKANSLHSKDSLEYYKENYSASHSIRVTSDNTKMRIFHVENGERINLKQAAVCIDSKGQYKTNYFQPTISNIETVYLTYFVSPKDDIQVKSVVVNYYAFVESEDPKTPTLMFNNKPTSTITIYENGVLLYGEELEGSNGEYLYEVNTETYDSTLTRTKAGKYEVVRLYTDDSVVTQNDLKERRYTFIVDRNGIIEEPSINELGQATYFVGSGIQLQIINSFGTDYYTGSETLHFYDIYYATKLSQTSLVPVLTTNFLPVTVYIPTFKYGYFDQNEKYPTFKMEDSVGTYINEKEELTYYSNYYLTATVTHYKNDKLEEENILGIYKFDNLLTGYNFLTTKDSEKPLPEFSKEGYYRVVIDYKNSEKNDKSSFAFVFRIQYQEPQYELLDSGNTAINTDGEVYYTSKDTIRISWEDSSSPYLARINKNAIKLSTVINEVRYDYILDVDKCEVKSAGENKYYVEVNLSDLKAKGHEESINIFGDGNKIDITLQFNGTGMEGEEGSGEYLKYFSKTKKLVIDLEAPVANISRLIALTGLRDLDLREYVDNHKYYTSKNTGSLKNFAYTVDISNFKDLIYSNAQAGSDYYRLYYRLLGKNGVNIKYTGSSKDGETDITISGFSGQMDGIIGGNTVNTFDKIILTQENVGSYIEFVEEDYAGNRTVYTIYLSDIMSDDSKTAFTYKSLSSAAVNDGNIIQSVAVSKITNELNLYSKRAFNLESINIIDNNKIGNLYWQIITIDENTYIKSPYREKYFKYNDKEEKEYTLAELSLLQAGDKAQSIILNMVPKYTSVKLNIFVLNKTLKYYILSQTSEGVNADGIMSEGVLVQIPLETEKNALYATKITIKAENKTYIVEGDYLRKEQEIKDNGKNNIKLSYTNLTLGEELYLRVEIVDKIKPNDYFVYTIVDNFGEVYRFVHIYGQTEINEPVISEGFWDKTYNEDGSIVYYSSENIEYRFDTTIYERVNISINLNRNAVVPIAYIITKNGNSFVVTNRADGSVVDKTIFEQYFKLTVYSNVLCITMLGTPIDFSGTQYGGNRYFALELVPKEVFQVEPLYMNFEIYNELPNTLKIMAKESAIDVTAILNGNTAFAGEVVINYIYTKLAYEYELFIINPKGERSQVVDGMVLSESGTYRIGIDYLGDIAGCSKAFDFTVASGEKHAYSVAKRQADGTFKNVSATGKSFTYTVGGFSESITTHFIVNSDYEIILNSNLYLQNTIVKSAVDVDGYTYIHKITNIGTEAANKGLITEYYSTLIAVSVIAQSEDKKGDILNRLVHYGENVKENSNGDLLTFATPQLTPYAIDEEQYNLGSRIAWSKYNLIPENSIIAEIYFGDIDGVKYEAKIEEYNGLNSIVLKTSGIYYIKFVDLAGNTQLFGTYNDNEYFTIRYLSSVIFEVENENPINHAIYDKQINISIPETTLSYYVVNGKPTINVLYNGEEFTDYEKVGDYSWNFSKPGSYKVWFSAKIKSGDSSNSDADEQIYEQQLNFIILSSKESRLAYTYHPGNSNYYIEDIKLNGESKNEMLANINNGELLKLNGKNYLKELSLHANDIKTGQGSWTFVVNTNNEFGQKFEFTIWINKPKVPIIISVANGEETTDNIIIKFNTQNVLDQAGDCILQIKGFDDLILKQELLDNKEIDELYELTIDKKGQYYIDIRTLSGTLLYSAYVVKNEPLNTVSIIIIVVVSVVLIVAIILFIRLRKKMKIR